jgi:signal transduction histidine kinase
VEEVEELNAQLEKRVAVRTAELEDANRLLHEQIIERQKAEANAARNHEAHLKLKGEFLSHVSHELRSPLTVVHQFTTILLDGIAGKLSTTQREYLEITLRNVNQLKHMIDDLLDASRSEAGKLTVRRSSVSLTDIVTQTVKSQIPIAAQRNIALKTEMPTGLPPIYADPARITQVLTNVLENAVKFSPASSAITIRSRIDESDPSCVRVSVADCGCGIKPEDVERVFDRLYQVKNSTETSRKGLGLGLYISKELVDLHGGRIWIDKTTITGTTVHLTFPIFTIKGLIAPILTEKGRLAPFLALVTIKVHPKTPWPTERDRDRALYRVQQVLDRCVLPDLDAVLPAQNKSGSDFFVVAARTDGRGSEVLLARIREQLSHCMHLKEAGVNCTAGCEVMDLYQATAGLPADQHEQRVVTQLLERLEAKFNRETENHGR